MTNALTRSNVKRNSDRATQPALSAFHVAGGPDDEETTSRRNGSYWHIFDGLRGECFHALRIAAGAAYRRDGHSARTGIYVDGRLLGSARGPLGVGEWPVAA